MTARWLRFDASKDDAPVWPVSVAVIRCYHGRRLGVHIRRGMRRWSIMWRLCK